MGRRYWGDYDEFYERKPAIKTKTGIKSQSKRGAFGESWWAKRWLDVLNSYGLGARLTRGRSYARNGQVISIDVTRGQVRAKVQGLALPPRLAAAATRFSRTERLGKIWRPSGTSPSPSRAIRKDGR